MLKFSILLIFSSLLLAIVEGLGERTHSLKAHTKGKISEKAEVLPRKETPMIQNYENNVRGKKAGKHEAQAKQVASKVLSSKGSTATILIKSAGRIINGTSANKRSFPFLVSIQAHNAKLDRWDHGCGGSIATEKIVITACHCIGSIVGDNLFYGNFKKMRIVAGTASLVRLAPTAQIRKVSAAIGHPRCSNFPEKENGWFESDVGLLVVSTPFEFNAHVQPMKLFSHEMSRALQKQKQLVEQGKSCVVPGWGSTVEFKVQHPEVLMASKVKLISDGICRASYCERTERHCAADFNSVGQVCGVSEHSSDCQGDSGGPLVCDGEVFGTVSYGERCIPGWPSVFQGVRPILELLKTYKSIHQSSDSPVQQN